MVEISIYFFAQLKELMGQSELKLSVAENSSIEDIWQKYLSPQLASLHGSLRIAKNCEYVAWSDLVKQGDELVFIPPVAGG